MLFYDRIEAGKELAKKIEFLKGTNPIVLAIPRGGVIIGDVIATSLKCNLDIILSKKIGVPENPELAIGVILPDGNYFLNDELMNLIQVPHGYIETEKTKLVGEITKKMLYYRHSTTYNIENKTAILVDDGIATGATMIGAAMWLKKQNPKKIVAAVPVATKSSINKIKKIVDSVIVVNMPDNFNAVSQFYEKFDQVDDQEVYNILNKYRN